MKLIKGGSSKEAKMSALRFLIDENMIDIDDTVYRTDREMWLENSVPITAASVFKSLSDLAGEPHLKVVDAEKSN